jgi:hypothetical protein
MSRKRSHPPCDTLLFAQTETEYCAAVMVTSDGFKPAKLNGVRLAYEP